MKSCRSLKLSLLSAVLMAIHYFMLPKYLHQSLHLQTAFLVTSVVLLRVLMFHGPNVSWPSCDFITTNSTSASIRDHHALPTWTVWELLMLLIRGFSLWHIRVKTRCSRVIHELFDISLLIDAWWWCGSYDVSDKVLSGLPKHLIILSVKFALDPIHDGTLIYPLDLLIFNLL
jgi:hypothetical protein